MQKAMANALGVVNIGGIFVVLLVGLAFAVLVSLQFAFLFKGIIVTKKSGEQLTQLSFFTRLLQLGLSTAD